MLLKKLYLFTIIFLLFFLGHSQGHFRILKEKKSVVVPFKLVNNLIVISVEVNGKELPFLFDSGVDKTILFNLKLSDSLKINNEEKIVLHGLGQGDPIHAIRSKNNVLRIKNIINPNQLIYVLLGEQFDLSAKMGIDINGIIGGDLFRNFIVKINYNSKRLVFYNPDTYEYKKCKNCISFPLEFYKRKPLINVVIENHLREKIDVKLLIDSGGGDALWLFEDSHPKISVPERYFNDFLGKGLSGNIYGKRSLLKKLIIGDFVLENVSVSYPDSLSVATALNNRERNGTLGANILTRFHVIFDYPNKKISLRKNGSKFNDPFYYNKSGIEVIYGGEMLVKEKKSRMVSNHSESDTKSITHIIFSYGLAFKPSYQIVLLRDDSPAKKAGLLVGDIFLKINGKTAYELKLQEIVEILSGKANKKITLSIDRSGKQLKYSFLLKDLL